MSRSLIIGGAGFIGANLARREVHRGQRPVVAASPTSDLSRLADVEDKIDLELFDFNDQTQVERCLSAANADRVYFFASHSRAMHDSRVEETRHLIDRDLKVLFNFISAAANASRPPRIFLRAASLAEYGASPTPYQETNRDRPLTPYGAMMSAGTVMLAALKQQLPFMTVSLRLALIYGPRQSSTFLIPQLIEDLRSGRTVSIRNPDATRDLLYVDDALDAFEKVDASLPDSVDCINICSGNAPSMREVAEAVIAATGVDPSLVTYGDNLRGDGAIELVGDASLAENLLGWRARTTLTEGLLRLTRPAQEAAQNS